MMPLTRSRLLVVLSATALWSSSHSITAAAFSIQPDFSTGTGTGVGGGGKCRKVPVLSRSPTVSFGNGETVKAKVPRGYLQALSDDDDDEANASIAESDQLVVGIAGTGAALVMLYSEFVLSQTGCGLPAGPFGLVGAVEGLSYLSVVALVGYALFQKITTGSGLPAGKYGLLGLAEGMAFLAIFAGAIVLGLQVTNYGYIPNAVPMEGGMCQ